MHKFFFIKRIIKEDEKSLCEVYIRDNFLAFRYFIRANVNLFEYDLKNKRYSKYYKNK